MESSILISDILTYFRRYFKKKVNKIININANIIIAFIRDTTIRIIRLIGLKNELTQGYTPWYLTRKFQSK